MKCAPLLTLVLVGLVAGDGAWEQNKVYTYKLVARTFKLLPESNNELVGVISRAYLSIRPQSDDLLIGKITQAEFGEVTQQYAAKGNADLNDRKLEDWPLNKPFKIHLENGVIRSLSVDNSMTNYEINQLKVIASQFQVDTNAQNRIQYRDNQLPEKQRNNAFYKTMEPLVTGNCETVYDISPIPQYLIQSHPEWVPLPELNQAKEFIQIVKSRVYNNCHETSDYHLDIAGRNELNTKGMGQNNLYLSESRRIVISGSLERYTIQSSVTVNKVINRHNDNSPVLTDYVNVTLESVEQSTNGPQLRLENLMNLKNVGNLVYNYDSDLNASPIKSEPYSRLFVTASGFGFPDERWSNCWTAFPAASTLCKSEFGPEFEDTNTQTCGFLGLGKKAQCRMSYPGCKATPCYTVFIARSELCERTFGKEFPVTRGGFEDCSPGFYRSRCCAAKSYE